MKDVLVFFNQMLNPFLGSGGDVRCAETIKRWKGLAVSVIGPKVSLFLKNELRANKYYSLPENLLEKWYQKNRWVFLIGPVYLLRAIHVLGLVKNLQFDTLYTTGDFLCNTLPAYWIKRSSPEIKWVANVFHLNLSPFKRRKNNFFLSLGSFFLQKISLLLLRNANLIILLNKKVKNSLIKMGFDKNKLEVLGAGIDFSKIAEIKDNKRRENKVIFLGRLNVTKGIYDLPKIWPLVLKESPDAKLIIIGAGDPATILDLKREFNRLKIEKSVKFEGFIKENTEVYKILKTGKVFILPSYEEGWGIVVFEAIACGLAPVVYDLPIFKEIFGQIIQSAPLGNTYIFSQNIVKFLKGDALRERYTFSLKRKIDPYDWEKISKKEFDLIKKL